MITPIKAIGKHCVECSGDSWLEATFCWCDECPLWPFRLGVKPSSPVYHRRIKAAWDRGGETIEQIKGGGKNMADFTKTPVKRRGVTGNTGQPCPRYAGMGKKLKEA